MIDSRIWVTKSLSHVIRKTFTFLTWSTNTTSSGLWRSSIAQVYANRSDCSDWLPHGLTVFIAMLLATRWHFFFRRYWELTMCQDSKVKDTSLVCWLFLLSSLLSLLFYYLISNPLALPYYLKPQSLNINCHRYWIFHFTEKKEYDREASFLTLATPSNKLRSFRDLGSDVLDLQKV